MDRLKAPSLLKSLGSGAGVRGERSSAAERSSAGYASEPPTGSSSSPRRARLVRAVVRSSVLGYYLRIERPCIESVCMYWLGDRVVRVRAREPHGRLSSWWCGPHLIVVVLVLGVGGRIARAGAGPRARVRDASGRLSPSWCGYLSLELDSSFVAHVDAAHERLLGSEGAGSSLCVGVCVCVCVISCTCVCARTCGGERPRRDVFSCARAYSLSPSHSLFLARALLREDR